MNTARFKTVYAQYNKVGKQYETPKRVLETPLSSQPGWINACSFDLRLNGGAKRLGSNRPLLFSLPSNAAKSTKEWATICHRAVRFRRRNSWSTIYSIQILLFFVGEPSGSEGIYGDLRRQFYLPTAGIRASWFGYCRLESVGHQTDGVDRILLNAEDYRLNNDPQ